MVKIQKNSAWKAALPQSYHWLGQLECSSVNSPVAGAHHLVVVTTDKAGQMQIDAPLLPAALKTRLEQASAGLGLKGSNGVIPLLLDQSCYLLVASSSLNISAKQKGLQAGLDTAAYCKNLNIKHLVLVAGQEVSSLDLLEGVAQGFYDLQGFKGENERKELSLPAKVSLLDQAQSPESIQKVLVASQAMALARMIEDAPSNWLNPEKFALIASEIASELGLRCTVKSREELEALGMGSFLSVGSGSRVSPKLIVLEIPGENPDKTVALVGKGLTFDTGGVCLKPSAGMEEMKYDMCGGAALLGAAYILAKFKPPVSVVCLIGAVENLLSADATRPGDIVQAMNGKTIEILNTDAEGRLVLADLLYYAHKEWQPALLVDVATLTGAVLMALGSFGSAIMTNQQSAANYLLNISQTTGEPLWQLPLWPELAREMRSDVADLKNIPAPSVKAGTITAAAFLREFVGDTPWVHVDIAGTGWNCKASGFPSKGSSGFMVKTLAQACLAFEKL